MRSGADDSALLQTWRQRHANIDALAAWRHAPVAEAGQYAFIAVALDPSVLDRLDPLLAIRLAQQARLYLSITLGAAPAGAGLRAAAGRFVRAAVWDWQCTLPDAASAATGTEPADPAADARPRPADIWQTALRNFPQSDGRTGRAAAELVARSGGAVLAEARQPWDQLLALATLRFAARVARGDITRCGLDSADLLGAVVAVQRFAARTGRSPLRVPYVGRYGTPAEQAATLSRDAATLARLVPEAQPAAIWADTEAMHAFAAVALDREILQTLALADALRLAAAAIRFADRAAGANPVQMPLLPPGCAATPAGVAAAARAGLLDQDAAVAPA